MLPSPAKHSKLYRLSASRATYVHTSKTSQMRPARQYSRPCMLHWWLARIALSRAQLWRACIQCWRARHTASMRAFTFHLSS